MGVRSHTGTSYLEANLSDLSGQWRRKKLFPCSYAIVAEMNPYHYVYTLEYLKNSTAPFLEEFAFLLLLVLDWRIGVDNCKQAQRNPTTFACQGNSVWLILIERLEGTSAIVWKGMEVIPTSVQDAKVCTQVAFSLLCIKIMHADLLSHFHVTFLIVLMDDHYVSTIFPKSAIVEKFQ